MIYIIDSIFLLILERLAALAELGTSDFLKFYITKNAIIVILSEVRIGS